MLTAIYAYSSTSLMISTAESNLKIDHFGGGSQDLQSDTAIPFSPGVYTITSTDPLRVTYSPGPAIQVVAAQTKDEIPPPKPELQTIPSSYQTSSFSEAFGAYLNVRG